MRGELFDKVRQLNIMRERSLAEGATRSAEGVRRLAEDEDIRPSFSRDTDRIIHSRPYTRYIDKTQVFYWVENLSLIHI